ncbi:hypothetical protein [Crocinitomix catalasitica]|uniref:hypothetical protein n=1 Tax=Crocinitomix catalasitica TaxID=184607 RepID=UPI0004892D5E|nr:hypothetical protein [Crocinitomix catalasitica]
MKLKLIIVCSALTMGLFFGCKKAISPLWLVAKIQLIDSRTGNPVPANFKLEYLSKGPFGHEHSNKDMGKSDDFGYFEFKERVGLNQTDFKLIILPRIGGYLIPYQFQYKESIPLSENSRNKITFALDPIPYGKIVLNNTDCYDETDSLWLKSSYSKHYNFYDYTGCIENDTIHYWAAPYEGTTLTYQTISKKNNILDTLTHTINLEYYKFNEIRIDY